MSNHKTTVSKGTKNVFEDLGYSDPVEHQTKAKLVSQIAKLIERQHMTQSQAATRLGVDQPKISAILNGRFRGFSVYRLMSFVSRLGLEVNIVTKNRSRPAKIEKIPVAG